VPLRNSKQWNELFSGQQKLLKDRMTLEFSLKEFLQCINKKLKTESKADSMDTFIDYFEYTNTFDPLPFLPKPLQNQMPFKMMNLGYQTQ
jgi:hypothetical protein